LFRHDRNAVRRNIARAACESPLAPRLIRSRFKGTKTMTRSPRAAGFGSRATRVASTRLNDAVAAALAIGSLSLCLIVTLMVFSIKVSMAMPIPA